MDKDKQNSNRLTESIRYIDPASRDYRDYFDHLIAYNRTFQRIVAKELKKIPYSDNGTHIFMTAGSDARLEKGPVSTIEVITLAANSSAGQEITEELRKYISDEERKGLFEQELETRYPSDLSSSWILRRGQPDEYKAVSVNRVFDAVKLAGDAGLIRNFKSGLVGELRSESGRSIIHNIDSKTKEYRHVAQTGKQNFKQRELTHYDLGSGMAFYDPSNNTLSFKQGPLRAIQFALVRDQSKAIRSGSDPSVFFDVPENTVEKINALEVQGELAISEQDARLLCDHYKYFMWLYHTSQANYNKGSIVTGFDAGQTRARVDDLVKLLSSGPLIKRKEIIV